MSKQYLSYEESVKMLREALKRNFPGVRFSVAKSYQRGTSVRVRYGFGPTVRKVKAVTDRFEGAGFDGMTDSTYYNTSTLVAQDGTMRDVGFGIHFLFVDRDTPQALYDATVAELAKGWEPKQWASYPSYERERIARPGVESLDTRADESPEDFAKRAVEAIFSGHALTY